MGNGSLLATFDSMGELEQIFAPNIDALQSRIGVWRSEVLVSRGGGITSLPLVPEEFEVRIRLLSGTQILHAEYQHRKSALSVTRRMGLHPSEPVILDQWEISEPAGIWHQSIPWIGHSTSAHCSLFHPDFNGMVHHRGRRWMGILSRTPIQWVRVGHLSDHDRGRLWNGERIHLPLSAHELGRFPAGSSPQGWDHVVQGPATWGAFAVQGAVQGPAQSAKVEFQIICAESEQDLGQMVARAKGMEAHRFFLTIDGMSARRRAPAADTLERISHSGVRSLCERSIDVLHALQDSQTGALMAAAEVDPHSRFSGGYGYSWPRDGAYLAAALGAFGFRERVEHYFRFLVETQDVSGTWWQRYLSTRHAGPSWGRIQIDEPATVISAAWLHFRRTQDLFWLEKIWPTLIRGLRFLENFHAPEHPLGLPSHDLWEERMGIHAYSLGAVAAAFRAGAALAGELSDRSAENHFMELGRALSEIVAARFVPADGPIHRSLLGNGLGSEEWDGAVDASLLGLISPFGIFQKRDASAKRIVEQVRSKLWNPTVGGVMRYEGDHYRGGNPWILTTLWLASIDLGSGNTARAREAFHWAMSKATPHLMLGEQVHRESGQPCWVIPLGWSHAMLLLFVREVLDRRLEREIWQN